MSNVRRLNKEKRGTFILDSQSQFNSIVRFFFFSKYSKIAEARITNQQQTSRGTRDLNHIEPASPLNTIQSPQTLLTVNLPGTPTHLALPTPANTQWWLIKTSEPLLLSGVITGRKSSSLVIIGAGESRWCFGLYFRSIIIKLMKTFFLI